MTRSAECYTHSEVRTPAEVRTEAKNESWKGQIEPDIGPHIQVQTILPPVIVNLIHQREPGVNVRSEVETLCAKGGPDTQPSLETETADVAEQSLPTQGEREVDRRGSQRERIAQVRPHQNAQAVTHIRQPDPESEVGSAGPLTKDAFNGEVTGTVAEIHADVSAT